ncbi:MAG: septum formation initiator family protein [Eubacteriales bacterium]|nr:septum formation initiator family protein [Eubacteriales bacterium]
MGGKTFSKAKKPNLQGKKLRLVVFFVIFGYFVWVFTMQQIEIFKSKKKLAEINAEIAYQKEIQEDLLKQKELINSPEYMENLARTELGYARPDEIIFFDATLKN